MRLSIPKTEEKVAVRRQIEKATKEFEMQEMEITLDTIAILEETKRSESEQNLS